MIRTMLRPLLWLPAQSLSVSNVGASLGRTILDSRQGPHDAQDGFHMSIAGNGAAMSRYTMLMHMMACANGAPE